jgi:cell division septation protein DedD
MAQWDNERPGNESPGNEGLGTDRDEFTPVGDPAGEDAAPLGAAHDDVDNPDASAARLPLDSDDDVRLPWLESGDDDADDDTGGGALMKLALLGLLALVVIVGGIWFASRKASGPELVADGGVIAAPDQPYKEKPSDPGGRTFAGTGDTSFAVSEGQSRPAGMAAEGAAARPGFETVEADPGKTGAKPALAAQTPGAAAASKPAAASHAASPAPAASGVGVQVGAFSSRAAAEAAWSKLSQQHQALTGLPHRVVEGRADIGTVYRLQAVSADGGAARALCSQLRGAGLACQVKN